MPSNTKALGRIDASFDFSISGDTFAAIKAFEDEIEKRYNANTVRVVLQTALTSGARSIVPDVRARMPHQKYGTGRLRGAIRGAASRFITPASIVGISLGNNRGDTKGAYYAWIYTKGAKRHTIQTRRARFLHLGSIVVRSVEHPGFLGRSFIPQAAARALPKMVANTAKVSNHFFVDEAFQQRIFKIVNKQQGG
jgi:hypothetical protein